MCGRYSQTHLLPKLRERFKFQTVIEEFRPRYNISPTQNAPVIIDLGEWSLEMFRWGLMPVWAKDYSVGYRRINARGESIHETESFKRPFQKNRCLVISDGFYEWKKDGANKIPMRIALKSKEPFAFAGIWDTWCDPEGQEVRSFSIITTMANDSVKDIHERMPAILNEETERIWLDPNTRPEQLMKLIVPYSGKEMETYAVSSLVNSTRNDHPGCIMPISDRLRASPAPARGLF